MKHERPSARRYAGCKARWVAAATIAGLTGFATASHAQTESSADGDDSHHGYNDTVGASSGQSDLRRRRRPDPTELRSEQYGAFELRLGPYRPRVDDEFNGGASPYEDIFGTSTRYHIGFEVDWQILRIPYLGSLGPGIQAAYTRASGRAPFSFQDGFSDEDTSLWIIPISALAVLRIDVLAHQFNVPLVPYLKAGLTYALWGASSGGGTDRHNGFVGRGAETGYQAAVGLMFWLNVLHPQSALDMDNATGINNTYIFGELFRSDVNSFGTGMQVGTNSWVGGLAFEF